MRTISIIPENHLSPVMSIQPSSVSIQQQIYIELTLYHQDSINKIIQVSWDYKHILAATVGCKEQIMHRNLYIDKSSFHFRVNYFISSSGITINMT